MSSLPPCLKGQKASEVFHAYVAPFLADYFTSKDSINLEELEEMLKVPWLVWNVFVLKKQGITTVDYLGSMKLLLKDKPREMRKVIDSLYDRKKRLFNQYDYLLGDFHLSWDPHTHEIKLTLEARIPP